MTNVYYNHDSGQPMALTRGTSALLRYEFDLIAAAFTAVQNAGLTASLPGQPGNSGKFIRTDGANASWQLIKESDISTRSTTLLGYSGITATNARAELGAQTALGFTPVQQGTGTSQTNNLVKVGWSAANVLRLQVDSTDYGATWPISISGNATSVTGINAIANGGTGSGSAATALSNLGAMPIAGGAFTGTVGFPSAVAGVMSIGIGTGDGASYSIQNTRMHLHWGLGLEDYAGNVMGYYDARNGIWDTKGGFKKNGADCTPLGLGQTWQDFTGFRSAATTYTNSTGRTIQASISVLFTSSGGTEVASVGGVVIGTGGGGGAGTLSSLTLTIPAGASYYITVTNGTIYSWAELR